MDKKVYAVYRRRIPYVGAVPHKEFRHDVICALFGTEAEVKLLEQQAGDLGYELWWEEIPISNNTDPAHLPSTVFIVFQGGYEQDDPDALEFSNPVGIVATFNLEDAESAIHRHHQSDSLDIWKLPIPWQSPFALHPFTKKHLDGGNPDFEYSLQCSGDATGDGTDVKLDQRRGRRSTS